MPEPKRLSALWHRTGPRVHRVLCLLFILSFLLPFVAVKGCESKTTDTWYGFELLKGDAAWIYLTAIGIFVCLIILSLLVKAGSASWNAFTAGWRALAAATAGLAVLLFPELQFLFDTVSMRGGQLLAVVCAALIFAGSMAEASFSFVALRRGRPEGPSPPGALVPCHATLIFLALALVPGYAWSLRNEVGLVVLYFLCLTLPFVLVELVAIEGARRGERWTRRWAPMAAVVVAAATALTVLSLFWATGNLYR